MAKTLNEVYMPRNAMDKKMLDIHKNDTVLKKSKPTENDAQFKGTAVKTFNRSKHRYGHSAEDDYKTANGQNPNKPDPDIEVPKKFTKEDITFENVMSDLTMFLETHDIDHPVYHTREKAAKHNGEVNPLNASYHTAGKMLKKRTHSDKAEHVKSGDEHVDHHRFHHAEWSRKLEKAHQELKKTGKHPGPHISGAGSEHFPSKTKDELRHHAHSSSHHSSAAFAHYAASGMRLPAAQKRYHDAKNAHLKKELPHGG